MIKLPSGGILQTEEEKKTIKLPSGRTITPGASINRIDTTQHVNVVDHKSQSNNPPSVQQPRGNALDIAKQVIAKPQPIPQNPFAKKTSPLPYNPAALQKAQQIQQQAQGKTQEQLRQHNAQNLKNAAAADWKMFKYGAENLGAGALGALEDVGKFIGTAGLEGASKIAGALVENDASRTLEKAANDFANIDTISDKWNRSIEKRYKPSEKMQVGGNINQGFGRLLPVMVTGAAGAAGTGINAAAQAQATQNVGQILFGTGAAGAGMKEAIEGGATVDQAVLYGAATAVTEMAIERIAGSVPGLPKGKVTQIIEAAKGSPLLRTLADLTGEGGEETLSEFITPYLQRAIYDPDAQNATAEEIWNAAATGMAVGLAAQGAGGNINLGLKQKSDANVKIDFETQKSYLQQIDDVMTGKASRSTDIVVGDTPEILLQYGANPHNLSMKQSSVRKIAYPSGYMGGQHNLGFYALEQLPAQLADPVAILKSSSQDNSLVVFTEFLDDHNNPVMVPLHLDKKGNLNVSNEVASMYGRGNFDSFIAAERAMGNVLYEKTNRALQDLPTVGLQLPKADAYTDPISKIRIAQQEESVNTASEPAQLPPSPDLQQPQQLPPGPNASFGANTVGAAQPNVGSYANLQTEHGVVDPGENPARMIDMPVKDANGQVNSLFARTVAESEHMPDEMVEEWEEAVARGDFSHSVATDKAAISSAERKLSQGRDKAMSSWQEVVNGEKVATKNDIALGELLLANAMKDGDTATAMRLTAELCAEATRAGQAVQAMRLLKKMTPQGQLYYLQKMVNNLNEDFKGRRNFNGITIDEGLADNLVKATTREEMDAAIKAIRKNVAEQTPVTWQDRWNAWRYLSMLGNPTTHFRNILGNALFAPVVSTKNRVGQIIESAFKNTPYLPYATKAVVNKNTAEGRELLDFAAADYENAAPEIQGVGKYSEKDQVLSERQVLPGIIGKAADFNTKALDAEDVFFSKLRYRNSLASYLKANNITVEQAKADPKVLDQARRYAIKEAQKATYRDASYVASVLNKAKRNLAKTANNTQNGMGKRLGARALEVGLEGALPFTKTPINILKRGVEYSPAGLAKSLTYDLYQVKQGNMTAAEAIDGIAAGLTGSALVALGWFMSSMGWVTGGPDEDDRRNRYESMLGRQDYSLNFGGSTYTIDWLAPESLPFFVGVSLQEDRGDDATFVERMLGTLSAIAEPMIEMSMLQGINSTLESIKYSQGVPVADVVGSLATSYAGQGIPTVFGKIARSVDPTSRQTYYDPNKTGVVKAADVFRQKAQAKSPWEGSLQPRVDLWGRTEQNPGRNFAERFAYNMLSPGYLEQKKTTEVDKELLKLAEATGETKVFPDAADKTFKLPASDGGETVKLNAEEYTQYAKDKGQKSYDIFDSIIGTKTWNSLSNEERVEVAGKVYEYANAVAKSNVSDYTLQDTAAKIQKCEKAGIPAGVAIVAYCAQKDVKGDKDSKGNTIQLSASKNKKEAIDRMTPFITKKQRELLYELFKVSEKVW